MREPYEISWRVLAFAIFIAVVIFATGTRLTSAFQRPKDADLVAQFSKHKALLEEVRQLLAGNPPTQQRYDLYMAKLKKCGVSNVVRDEDELRFVVAASGFASTGYRIAITYTESQPKPLLPSLDQFQKSTHSWEQAYRQIEGNWYLWIIW